MSSQNRQGRPQWNNNGHPPPAPPLVIAPSRATDSRSPYAPPSGSPPMWLSSADRHHSRPSPHEKSPYARTDYSSYSERTPSHRTPARSSQEYPSQGKDSYDLRRSQHSAYREASPTGYYPPPPIPIRSPYGGDAPFIPPPPASFEVPYASMPVTYASSPVPYATPRAAPFPDPPLVAPPSREYDSRMPARSRSGRSRSRSPTSRHSYQGTPVLKHGEESLSRSAHSNGARSQKPVVCADVMFLHLAHETTPQHLTDMIAKLEGSLDVLDWSTNAYPITVPPHPSGGCRGFGFAKFRSISAAERFVSAHGPAIVDGHHLAGVPLRDSQGRARRPISVTHSQTDGPTRTKVRHDSADIPPIVVPPPPIVARPRPEAGDRQFTPGRDYQDSRRRYDEPDPSRSRQDTREGRYELHRRELSPVDHRSRPAQDSDRRWAYEAQRQPGTAHDSMPRRDERHWPEQYSNRSRSPDPRRNLDRQPRERSPDRNYHANTELGREHEPHRHLPRHEKSKDEQRPGDKDGARGSTDRKTQKETDSDRQKRRSQSSTDRYDRHNGTAATSSDNGKIQDDPSQGKASATKVPDAEEFLASINPEIRSKSKMPLATKKFAGDMSKWQSKQEELRDPEAEVPNSTSAVSAAETSAAANKTDEQATPATPSESIPRDFDFTDKVRLACLLCNRQFKSIDTVRRHTIQSDMHKSNLEDDALRAAGAKRIYAAQQALATTGGGTPEAATTVSASEATTDETSRYRDRAQERRAVFGDSSHAASSSSTGKRKFEGPAAPASSKPADPSAPLDASNKGSKMLAQMGWTAGAGLGAEGAGRTAPVDSVAYRPGAGLGVAKGADAHAQASNKELAYSEAAREGARRRLGA